MTYDELIYKLQKENIIYHNPEGYKDKWMLTRSSLMCICKLYSLINHIDFEVDKYQFKHYHYMYLTKPEWFFENFEKFNFNFIKKVHPFSSFLSMIKEPQDPRTIPSFKNIKGEYVPKTQKQVRTFNKTIYVKYNTTIVKFDDLDKAYDFFKLVSSEAKIYYEGKTKRVYLPTKRITFR